MENKVTTSVWMVIPGYSYEGEVSSSTRLFKREKDALRAQREMREKGIGDYVKVIKLPLE
jgi:hypothetical protein